VVTYHSSEGSGAWTGRCRYTLLIAVKELGVRWSKEAGLGIVVRGRAMMVGSVYWHWIASAGG
jgi:hypothetical protein